jgi:hypothetical protein
LQAPTNSAVVRACDTSAVAFHESFWVATSAAAPVIALAAIVALPDASTVVDVASRRLQLAQQVRGSDPLDSDAVRDEVLTREMRRQASQVRGTTFFNLLLQAGLLAVSLWALAYNQAVISPPDAIIMAVVGILLLSWTTTRTAAFRRLAARLPDPGTKPAGDSLDHKDEKPEAAE